MRVVRRWREGSEIDERAKESEMIGMDVGEGKSGSVTSSRW